MDRVKVRVCDNLYSGSDHSIFLVFKSKNLECQTCILDRDGIWTNDWNRGSTQTWGDNDNFLGNCTKDFRPYDDDELKFKVSFEIPRRYLDEVEICKLIVTFGKNFPKQEGSSRWVWGGDFNEEGVWTDDPGETQWLLLKKM